MLKTQEVRDEVVNTCFIAFHFNPNQCNPEEICDRVISKGPIMLMYCSYRWKNQKCNIA